ncbi:MAG: YchF/TatD family DNA exonuclease [bacterium]
MFVDTHAHLFYPNFNGEVEQVIERAANAGVDYVIVPATNITSSVQAIELADRFEKVYATVGVHPHDTKDWEDSLLIKLEELAKHKKVVAIGEIGLDYFYDFSPRDKQIHALESQIELAIQTGLPIIIHNRESNDDIMGFARKYKNKIRAQHHCFAGSIDDAQELIGMKHYISFTGNITFTKFDNIRKTLSGIDIESLLLETDSPFMAPVPYRGKRNEPAFISLVAEKVAEVHNLSIDDVARTTSHNAFRLFGIGEKANPAITYKIGNSLYVNVTNRCNADCVFCDRKGEAIIKGYNLKMNKSEEPEAEEYIKEIDDPKKFDEIVFCGYGEPTIRWEVVKKVAKWVKENGGKTRINTDGHGNVINKRDITPELSGLLDVVSISLNSTDPVQYAELMRVDQSMFYEMIEFAKKAKNYSSVVMTAVTVPDVDLDKARVFVENEIGVQFREREYF